MKNKLNIRYIVELVVTLILIMVITIVLVRMFVYSRNQSLYASELTGAVNAAQNAAELYSISGSREDLAGRLSSCDGVSEVDSTGDEISCRYTYENNGKTMEYLLKISVNYPSESAGLSKGVIEVFLVGKAEPIYNISTGKYDREAAQ